jgi:hypothetical protein
MQDSAGSQNPRLLTNARTLAAVFPTYPVEEPCPAAPANTATQRSTIRPGQAQPSQREDQ